ncbi:MAG: nitroreductase family protein [Spirochaetia bacterium]
MAQLLEAINNRRAYRALSEKPVARDVQDRLMEAATYAPSCSNKQPWRFLLADEESARRRVAENLPGGNYWAEKAPLYVLAVTKPELDCRLKDRREYALFDVGMAVMNLQLQAVEEGLRAHPIAGFDDSGIKKAFDIPEEYILITVVVIGHPGDPSVLSEKHLESENSERVRVEKDAVIARNGWDFKK